MAVIKLTSSYACDHAVLLLINYNSIATKRMPLCLPVYFNIVLMQGPCSLNSPRQSLDILNFRDEYDTSILYISEQVQG